MRQKKLSLDLNEIEVPVLPIFMPGPAVKGSDFIGSIGAQDVGLHIFSTAGLLDGSWYNRTLWMYSKRWPGFRPFNQAPKSGQLLVVDSQNTYAVKVFYRRNIHSPMFFPGEEGYLLYADKNTTEPQLWGEEGSRPPVEWLPQSDYVKGPGREPVRLDSPAIEGAVGYTRSEPPLWTTWVQVRVRAMVKAADHLFAAGPPDVYDEEDPFASFEGRTGAVLVKVSAADGQKHSETRLESPPVFDGMIAAYGRLYLSLENGSLLSLGNAPAK
jgi:hypothetical protein